MSKGGLEPGEELLSHSKSLCPVCLRALPASLVSTADGETYIRRVCPEHGPFSGLIWKGAPALKDWRRAKAPAISVRRETGGNKGCPHDCGRCPEHKQHACTVLFEITRHCNLHCPVCFADAGKSREELPDTSAVPGPGMGLDAGRGRDAERGRDAGATPCAAPAVAARSLGEPEAFTPLETLLEQLRWIRAHAGEVVLQISGGEPTLHPELPALIRAGRELFPAVQLNTNGLLLADRAGFAEALAAAGLSWVFLQFDGTDDAIFISLRGRALLQKKLRAIERCKEAGLSVVLVPTVAAGVNDRDLGNILRLALRHAPTVRGVHLQPMTAAGRNMLAGKAGQSRSLTLPEVLQKICEQSDGLMRPEHATPPGCEHERCSFHCRYSISPSGSLRPLRAGEGQSGPCCPSAPADDCCSREKEATGAEDQGLRRAIDTILRSWQGPDSDPGARPSVAARERKAGPGSPDSPDSRDSPDLPGAPGGADGAGVPGESGPSGAFDALDSFIAQARNRSFSVTCMAFQDAWNVDLERLQGCCVHVFDPSLRLIPFCARNMTALDGRALHPRGW
ncbi:radical SAM protein [Desulfovibrio sp. OttesenSCG-928-A18]|nr:radical SAM protein [Desulfovibrio sp. OttesenSCG-928-A18]